MIMTTIAKTLTIAAVTALALGIAPKAKANCSEAALKGHHFAYTSTGFILTAPVAAIVGPSAEVGVEYFDGGGDVSFNLHSSQNGYISSGTVEGNYTVNDDCTGTFTQIFPKTETTPKFTTHFTFVIDENGREFQAICQDSGVVATLLGRRQFLESK
jgi:hypothetical protein